MSAEARRYLRKFKKLFDAFSERNSQNNSIGMTVAEAQTVRNSGEVGDDSATTQAQKTGKATKEIAERKAYRYAVDADLLKFVDSVSAMESKNAISKRKHTLGKISAKHAKIIEAIFLSELGLNIDADGYTVNIDGSAVKHIEERHGANGLSDHSMQDKADVARLGWAVNNAEYGYIARTQTGKIDYSSQYRNADGSNSPKIILEKSIGDGKLIVVECVPDAAGKKIHIISARKIKSGKGQVLNVKSNDSPQPTSETLLDGITTNNSISEKAPDVNPSAKNTAEKIAEKNGEIVRFALPETIEQDVTEKIRKNISLERNGLHSARRHKA